MTYGGMTAIVLLALVIYLGARLTGAINWYTWGENMEKKRMAGAPEESEDRNEKEENETDGK